MLARFASLLFVNITGSCYKKKGPHGAASSAERTVHENRGAAHCPSARRWQGYYQGGMVGASKCTNGPYFGHGTAKWAQIDLARGFARGLPNDNPDRDHGTFNARLSILMVAMVGVGEGRWVPGSGIHRNVVPLRAPIWGWLGRTGEMARASARASRLALTRPPGCVPSPTRPNPPKDAIWRLPWHAVALGAHG